MRKIHDFTVIVNKEVYAPLCNLGVYYRTITELKSASRGLDLRWFNILEDNHFIGNSIGRLRSRRETGISIVAIIRDDQFFPNPETDFVFQNIDLIGVIGEYRQLEKFKNYLAITSDNPSKA